LQAEKWDLYSAVALERRPLITRDLNELENKFNSFMKEVEFENSHKSDFEVRLESDKKREEDLKKGQLNIDLDNVPQQTAQDFYDSATAELKAFKVSPRTTPEENDLHSLNRHLDRHLLLIISEQIGNSPVWVLPQGKRLEGETMRQCAERVIKEKCGEGVDVGFYGNAPCGFYKYKYPKAVQKDTVGAKVFFFKAKYLKGDLKKKDQVQDYQWATRQELSKFPPEYAKSVNMFLINEEH